jgi:2-amino-4-hydroxy-6-hydroxymethyldihydropteridine diphosphokinase
VARAFVSVASNVEPERNVREALSRLATAVRIRAISSFYRSEPIGPPGQPPFVNGVVQVETDLEPRKLKFDVLRRIEAELGRVRTRDKYAPRTMDLDLLVYEDVITTQPGLTLPDPDIIARPFLAVALCELAPGMALPGDGRTMGEIAAAMPRTGMEPLADYTESLRESYTDGSG